MCGARRFGRLITETVGEKHPEWVSRVAPMCGACSPARTTRSMSSQRLVSGAGRGPVPASTTEVDAFDPDANHYQGPDAQREQTDQTSH